MKYVASIYGILIFSVELLVLYGYYGSATEKDMNGLPLLAPGAAVLLSLVAFGAITVVGAVNYKVLQLIVEDSQEIARNRITKETLVSILKTAVAVCGAVFLLDGAVALLAAFKLFTPAVWGVDYIQQFNAAVSAGVAEKQAAISTFVSAMGLLIKQVSFLLVLVYAIRAFQKPQQVRSLMVK